MWQERCNKWRERVGWGCGDDLFSSSAPPSPIFSLSITGATERGWNRAGGATGETRTEEGQGTKQSSVFLVTPQSAFQSARNRQQRIHGIHTLGLGEWSDASVFFARQ